MFLPSARIDDHSKIIRIDPFIMPCQNEAKTIAQKIKDGIAHFFQMISEFFQNLIWGTSSSVQDQVVGAYKVSCHLPMLETNKLQQDPYVILSLDGGGVRGIGTLAALTIIEEEINGRIINAVDSIAGVSTGAIIAAALSLPSDDNPDAPRYSAEEVANLYAESAEKIFPNSICRNISSLYGAIDSKYPSPRTAFESIIPDRPLSESIAQRLIITSVDLLTGRPVIFDTGEEDNTNLEGTHIARISANEATFGQAILGSTAAPTYFPSEVFKDFNLVDGGLAANNPAEIATLLATKGIEKDRPILVISIGTGKMPTEPVTNQDPLHWGWVQWILPLIQYFTDINANLADAQLKFMAENNPMINYVRFQILLENASEAQLDNASPENMQRLRELGTRCFQHFLDNGGHESVIVPLRQKLRASKVDI